MGGLIALAILAYYNPYLRHLEKDIGSHRQLYQEWLTTTSIHNISDKNILRYRVLWQASLPECQTGCKARGLMLPRQDDYLVAVWTREGIAVRVLVAYLSDRGRSEAKKAIERLKHLPGKQAGIYIQWDNMPLYDVSLWLETGRLRRGSTVYSSKMPTWFVVQGDLVGINAPPALFWCYWKADADGKVLQRGLYGS